jgi:hypothetical protein
MTTAPLTHAVRRSLTSRKDTQMQHPNLQLALVREYHARLRAERDADRAAHASGRSIRSRIGESIIRIGRRVAGENVGAPAWTG